MTPLLPEFSDFIRLLNRNRVKSRVGGIQVPFIDLERLRQNKSAAGRPKDLEDLRRLFGKEAC